VSEFGFALEKGGSLVMWRKRPPGGPALPDRRAVFCQPETNLLEESRLDVLLTPF
jgi:hypothetical protein